MNWKLSVVFLGFLCLSQARAQVTPTAELTLEGAKEIMAVATGYAQARQAPGAAIAIVDAGGALILLERLTGTFPIAAEIASGKARTAALFRFPSQNPVPHRTYRPV